ncbi:MAG TPA: chemotaxis protein CheA [Vitreimonas sp.]|uniref:chemotaxis protein CheA n=1 Tax=Vitreimonas sp. TaxID=3069702 RepID=UPI002D56D2BA|nr:chemotaxis protein CheA [Vitreimonas sp.]HYD88806.1 chemotaxis protein CheA [Vitreimonas sp.]
MDAMDAIKVTYFQECDELLQDLEQGLLALEAGEGDGETINAVFRAVHSVKGGAGAFGFEALVAFAHVFETALDAMRSGKLEPDADAIKLMLRASDVLSDLVQAAKNDTSVDEARSAAMAAELEALTNGEAETAPDLAPVANADEPAADEWGFRPVRMEVDAPACPAPLAGWRLVMRPTAAMYAKGHDAAVLLRELARLAPLETKCDAAALPGFDELDPEAAYLVWDVRIPAHVEEAAIRDVFDFVGDDCPIELSREEWTIEAPAPAAGVEPEIDIGTLLARVIDPPAPPNAASTVGDDQQAANAKAAKGDAAATIRVNLERVDRLIDLVGELVINQAMLSQRVAESGLARSSNVAIGLDELEQLTREIQDSVMAIRAQPVKSVFQRMPRLVREIAGSTGKQVRLVTEGENTEVDKTVIERLSDPITHMLRNAIDHGLEAPEDRIAAGKGAEGTVRLAALHRSGRIVIEVSDDGRGINRPRVREIAVNKGLIPADAQFTDDEIDNLIFLPGFSTAATVSNISGRGVGMDVVKRSIQALGGRISISSQPGRGSTFTLSLPLTLAVLDGMVVTVGEHTFVAPLSAIVETLQPKRDEVRMLGPRSAVLAARGSHLPLIDIGVALGWRTQPIDPADGVALLVEAEGGARAAVVVDAIQGQRQVVIKSLEANYQRVDAVAAATILGDGRVALILDIDALVDSRRADRFETPLAQAS